MKSLLLTLFYTKKGLNILDEEFEDDLFRKSLLLFCAYGIVNFIVEFKPEDEENGFLLNLVFLTISILGFVIVGMVFSYILYKIGKWINGKAKYIDIISLFAYALLPLFIGLITVRLFKKFEHIEFVIYLSRIISIKILYQGLVKFNKYGILKTILNLSFFIGLGVGLYFLLPNLIIE
ncbi:MAG: YIP1 family protein [Flavobacteriaceae bacterium]|nr:YIP1 family protein [Flavobacteriaceae bacterium]